MFTKQGHVESFWDDFTLNITHRLGLTYRKARRLNGNLASYSEAQLQQNNLNPILMEVSKAASIIPDIENETIKQTLSFKMKLKCRKEKVGKSLQWMR